MTTTIASVFFRKINRPFTKCKRFGLIKKKFNSYEWLKRRQTDQYVEMAKRQNYRCRSAFKLIEIDNKYQFIQPGFKVLDIGAAPGSWSQVLADRTNSNGKDENSQRGLVIAVDLGTFQEIEGVIALPNLDFIEKASQLKILEVLGKGQNFDFIFSDMAPAATGFKPLDQENIVNLVYPVILFAIQNLRVGGGCLLKLWEGGATKTLKDDMKKFFQYFNTIKPNASYKNSSEYFVLGRGFWGVKN